MHTHFCASICGSLYLSTFWYCLCWYLQFHSNTTEFIVLFSLSNCNTFPQQWKPTAILVTRKFLILSVLNTQKVVSELLTHTAEKNNSNKHSQFIYSSFCLQPEGIKSKYWVQKKVITFFFSFIIFYLCNAVTDLQYARFMFGRYFKVYLLLDLIDWIIDQMMGNLSLVPKVITVQWGVYSEPGLSPALCCVPFSSYS